MKKIIVNNNAIVVNLFQTPSNNKTPKTISKMEKNVAKGKLKLSKNGILRTVGEKYSSNLKLNPIGSTFFTNPEIIKITPTIIRANCTKYLMKFSFR